MEMATGRAGGVVMHLVRGLAAGLMAFALCGVASAHPEDGEVRYLGNEALLVSAGETRILFDPLFGNVFGIYQPVPPEMLASLMAGEPPYHDITAIFVSHAHGDHFAADQLVTYMAMHPQVRVFAPAQAAAMMREEPGADAAILDRVIGLEMERGDPAIVLERDGLIVEVVRIPHEGWPQLAEVQNLVFRVTLAGGVTVMHLGDADPDDSHFSPHHDHWQARETGTAFPPYWFFMRERGIRILEDRLNAREAVGIHVPVEVPEELAVTGAPFLHTPGETRVVPFTGHAGTPD